MKLVELSFANKNDYNRFVASAASGSFLQSWEWGQWQEKLGKRAYRFFVIDESQSVIAAFQVIHSPLPFNRYYLYIPYGPVGGSNFQFSISNFQFLIQELKKKSPDAVFIRIEPKAEVEGLHQFGKKSANIQPGKTLVVGLKKTDDELLAAMHPKTRYNIRVAQRHGVEIVSDLMVVPGYGLYFKEALDLIVGTADRQGFQTFSKSYYDQLMNFFALRNSQGEVKVYLYKALLNRELLAAAIMIDFGGTRTYLFGGSGSHHREVMAPHLLHWKAMVDARQAGLASYDFWGIETASGETPGFVRFKLGFGGRPISYPGAYDVSLNSAWYQTYKTLRRVNRSWLYVRKRLKF